MVTNNSQQQVSATVYQLEKSSAPRLYQLKLMKESIKRKTRKLTFSQEKEN